MNKKNLLKWTSFSQQMPENEELILMAEKGDDSIHYVVGIKKEENIVKCGLGGIYFSQNNKTGKIEHASNMPIDENDGYIKVGPKQWFKNSGDYQIKIDLWHWIPVTNILKYIQNIPIDQLKIGMDIVEIEKIEQNKLDEKLIMNSIRSGTVESINNQDIKIKNKYFVNDDKTPYQFSIHKQLMIGWIELPTL